MNTADAIAEILGTRDWVVAPALTRRLREKGFTLALPQPVFEAVKAEAARLIAGRPVYRIGCYSPPWFPQPRTVWHVYRQAASGGPSLSVSGQNGVPRYFSSREAARRAQLKLIVACAEQPIEGAAA